MEARRDTKAEKLEEAARDEGSGFQTSASRPPLREKEDRERRLSVWSKYQEIDFSSVMEDGNAVI